MTYPVWSCYSLFQHFTSRTSPDYMCSVADPEGVNGVHINPTLRPNFFIFMKNEAAKSTNPVPIILYMSKPPLRNPESILVFAGITALWSLSKTHYPSLVLVQPRKTCPCLTERFLMGHKESNQTKQSGLVTVCFIIYIKNT